VAALEFELQSSVYLYSLRISDWQGRRDLAQHGSQQHSHHQDRPDLQGTRVSKRGPTECRAIVCEEMGYSMVRITGSEQESRAGQQGWLGWLSMLSSPWRPWPWPRPCWTAASAKSDKTHPACTGTARRRERADFALSLPSRVESVQVQQGQEGGGSGAVGWETQIEQPRSYCRT